MMQVEIICPLYNARNYIIDLNKSLLEQKDVKIKKITYILTESKDDTEKIMKDNNIKYEKITSKEFSHSLTREKYALRSKADILVFITQDVVIENNDWLYELTKDINDKDIVACYSRQISKYNNIEKYTREFNYPDYDFVVSKDDLKEKVFKEVNGYDQKRLPISEDMYIIYKIIMKGYKVKYCSNSIVYHSHKFTLKQIYDRYKLTGKFFKENNYLDQYGTTGSGAKLAKYILKRIIQEFRLLLLFRYPFDMAARLLGMKAGER